MSEWAASSRLLAIAMRRHTLHHIRGISHTRMDPFYKSGHFIGRQLTTLDERNMNINISKIHLAVALARSQLATTQFIEFSYKQSWTFNFFISFFAFCSDVSHPALCMYSTRSRCDDEEIAQMRRRRCEMRLMHSESPIIKYTSHDAVKCVCVRPASNTIDNREGDAWHWIFNWNYYFPFLCFQIQMNGRQRCVYCVVIECTFSARTQLLKIEYFSRAMQYTIVIQSRTHSVHSARAYQSTVIRSI